MLSVHGGVGGGHRLLVSGGRLHYVYNWLGEKLQRITSGVAVPTGKHVFTVEFRKAGEDRATLSAVGRPTLCVDNQAAGQAKLTTQPDPFTLAGDGPCVGRDSGSSVSPDDYRPPYPFVGGVIDRVVVDVSGLPSPGPTEEEPADLARD